MRGYRSLIKHDHVGLSPYDTTPVSLYRDTYYTYALLAAFGIGLAFYREATLSYVSPSLDKCRQTCGWNTPLFTPFSKYSTSRITVAGSEHDNYQGRGSPIVHFSGRGRKIFSVVRDKEKKNQE